MPLKNNPIVVGQLVVVVGLKAAKTRKISKIRKKEEPTKSTPILYEQLSYTLPLLMY